MKSLTILGSTGSVGTQALDVVRHNPDRFKVVGLSAAGANLELLAGQIREFLPPVVAIADEAAAGDVKQKIGAVPGVEIVEGPDAAERLADETEADMVLNALVGSAGLAPTLAALQSGKTLALANKESLVVGGELVTDLIKGEPERLLPVDSEHAALAMAMRGERREDLKRVVLTGSGGPFRGWTRNELAKASVKEALQHPVWSMGPKITIDSATLMNKGLEVIEAHYLFDLEYSSIHVLIHPEGLVHAMAEFRDGSLRAEMATARHAPADPARARLARAPADRRRAGAAHRAPAHVRAGRPRSVPCRRSRLPRRRPGLDLPGGDERGERGGGHGLPRGQDRRSPASSSWCRRWSTSTSPPRSSRSCSIERADAWARQRAAEIVEER